ncbi:DUF2799 domain-containing protein [Moraxella sp. ZJ142]|uniref:DUF2799 domain-containing protein n=1 Tax=Moraxella marmotae TaxID=3344520 RepID=UPI0035D3FCBC
MKKQTLFLALGLPLMLTGCATMHSNQQPVDCAAVDWQSLGVADGQAGRYPYEITRHQKSCPMLAITPDVIKTWEEGRQIGLKQYCTKAYAYQIGQRGESLNQVCPEDGLLEIQQSHALGYQQYYRQSQLNRDWLYPFYQPWYVPMPYRYWR